MKSTWLVQRLEKPVSKDGQVFDNPFSFGGGFLNGGLSPKAMELLREIMAFDYMGAAEFEFGAVPKAFQMIATEASKGNLIADKEILDDRPVYYLCPKDMSKKVNQRIRELYKGDRSLKEPTNFHRSMEGEEYATRICGWLELDNGFMFFKDKEMFEQCCTLFGVQTQNDPS